MFGEHHGVVFVIHRLMKRALQAGHLRDEEVLQKELSLACSKVDRFRCFVRPVASCETGPRKRRLHDCKQYDKKMEDRNIEAEFP